MGSSRMAAELESMRRQHADLFAEARPRLLRFCAHLIGDVAVAEDLAQETLIEAWRHLDTLRDPAAFDAWLAGIARNMCHRWLRARARDQQHSSITGADVAGSSTASGQERAEQIPDALDLEAELEREELAELLHRALALLSPSARELLIERYLRDRAQSEVAARLGLSENVVAVRLHRGKLALRRVLTDRFQAEALTYGLVSAETAGWQETRVWCPECGQRHLIGRIPAPPANDHFQLRCPSCHAEPGVYLSNAPGDLTRPCDAGSWGFKRTLDRLMAWADGFYRPALAGEPAACLRCGAAIALHPGMPQDGPPSLREQPGVHGRCDVCGWEAAQGLGGLLLALPEGRRFWRAHGRIHMLPRRPISTGARPAFVTSFVSQQGQARLDIVSDAETHAVLGIHHPAGV